MIRIGIAGFGTVGRRIAAAVSAQNDMKVIGVAKTSASTTARIAEQNHGFDVYGVTTDDVETLSKGRLSPCGTLVELAETSDVVVDASPSGFGEVNKEVYESTHTPAVFQGGESASVAPTSFNSYAQLEDSHSTQSSPNYARVVSCNTTGLSRVISTVEREHNVNHVFATLIRRGGDPGQTGRGPINDTIPDPASIPSHHGPDVQCVLPQTDITTMAFKVPTTDMHMHAVAMKVGDDVTARDIRTLFTERNRIAVIPDGTDIDGAGVLREIAHEHGRPYGSLWENTVWGESITKDGGWVWFYQGVHQRSIIVPESIDAVRYVQTQELVDSVEKTDKALRLDTDLVL